MYVIPTEIVKYYIYILYKAYKTGRNNRSSCKNYDINYNNTDGSYSTKAVPLEGVGVKGSIPQPLNFLRIRKLRNVYNLKLFIYRIFTPPKNLFRVHGVVSYMIYSTL